MMNFLIAPLLGLGLVVPATMPGPMAERGSTYTVRPASESILAPAQRARVPDVAFADSSGVPVMLSKWRGRVAVVTLWATTCAPCVKQMAALNALQEQLGPLGLEVLALAQDPGGPSVARSFYSQQKLEHLKVYHDRGNAAGRVLGARGMPTTIVVDQRGREAVRLEGPVDWADPEVIAVLRSVLAGG